MAFLKKKILYNFIKTGIILSSFLIFLFVGYNFAKAVSCSEYCANNLPSGFKKDTYAETTEQVLKDTDNWQYCNTGNYCNSSFDVASLKCFSCSDNGIDCPIFNDYCTCAYKKCCGLGECVGGDCTFSSWDSCSEFCQKEKVRLNLFGYKEVQYFEAQQDDFTENTMCNLGPFCYLNDDLYRENCYWCQNEQIYCPIHNSICVCMYNKKCAQGCNGTSCVDSQDCIPSCYQRECGSDGCGGSCGTCPDGEECSTDGVCREIVCTYGAWKNQGCGKSGCAPSSMSQVRLETSSFKSCPKYESRCVPNYASCVTNSAPQISDIPNAEISEDKTKTYDISNYATDSDGDTLSYSITSGPGSIDSTTGVYSWTPGYLAGNPNSQSYDITIKVSDGSAFDTEQFTITVNDLKKAPIIKGVPQLWEDLNEGEQYTFDITITDEENDQASIDVGLANNTSSTSVCPTSGGQGAKLNGIYWDDTDNVWRTEFSYTPSYNSDSSYECKIIAIDRQGQSDSRLLKMNIIDVNQPPVISALSNITKNEGERVKFNVIITDPDLYDTLNVVFRSDPANTDMSFSAGSYSISSNKCKNNSGSLECTLPFSWTADYFSSGTYNLRFTATDWNNETSLENLVLTIADKEPSLSLGVTPSTNKIKEQETVSFDLKATSNDSSDELEFVFGSDSAGPFDQSDNNCSISGNKLICTYQFSWIPGICAAGPLGADQDYTKTFTVKELSGSGDTYSVQKTITVEDKNRQPRFTAPVSSRQTKEYTVLEHQKLQFTVLANDQDIISCSDNSLVYSCSDQIEGADRCTNNTFSWIPSLSAWEKGPVYEFQYLVEDSTSASNSTDFINIKITVKDQAPILSISRNSLALAEGRISGPITLKSLDGNELDFWLSFYNKNPQELPLDDNANLGTPEPVRIFVAKNSTGPYKLVSKQAVASLINNGTAVNLNNYVNKNCTNLAGGLEYECQIIVKINVKGNDLMGAHDLKFKIDNGENQDQKDLAVTVQNVNLAPKNIVLNWPPNDAGCTPLNWDGCQDHKENQGYDPDDLDFRFNPGGDPDNKAHKDLIDYFLYLKKIGPIEQDANFSTDNNWKIFNLLANETSEQTINVTTLEPRTDYQYFIRSYDNAPDGAKTKQSAVYSFRTARKPCTNGVECRKGEICLDLEGDADSSSGEPFYCVLSNECTPTGNSCYLSACPPGQTTGSSCAVSRSNRDFINSSGKCRDNFCDLSAVTPGSPRIYNQDILPSIAFWSFEQGFGGNQVYDQSSNYFGRIYGASWVNGVLGNALKFDGNDYVALDMFYNTKGGINELSVCLWFKTNQRNSAWTSNWSFVDFDRSDYYNFYTRGDNGKLGFSTTDRFGNVNDFFGTTNVADNAWHFACAVYDGTDKILYLDGGEEKRLENAHSGYPLGKGSTRYGFIGDGSEASSFNGNRNKTYYKGLIDELKIYDYALILDQVKAEMDSGRENINPLDTVSLSPEFFWLNGDPSEDWLDFKNDPVNYPGTSTRYFLLIKKPNDSLVKVFDLPYGISAARSFSLKTDGTTAPYYLNFDSDYKWQVVADTSAPDPNANVYSPEWEFSTKTVCESLEFDYSPDQYNAPGYLPHSPENQNVVYPVDVTLLWAPEEGLVANGALQGPNGDADGPWYDLLIQECDSSGNNCAPPPNSIENYSAYWGYMLKQDQGTTSLFFDNTSQAKTYLSLNKIYHWQVRVHHGQQVGDHIITTCAVLGFKTPSAPEVALEKEILEINYPEITYQIKFKVNGEPWQRIKDFAIIDEYPQSAETSFYDTSNPNVSDDVWQTISGQVQKNPLTLKIESKEYTNSKLTWHIIDEGYIDPDNPDYNESVGAGSQGFLVLKLEEYNGPEEFPECTALTNKIYATWKTLSGISGSTAVPADLVSHFAQTENLGQGFLTTGQGNIHAGAGACFRNLPAGATDQYLTDYFITSGAGSSLYGFSGVTGVSRAGEDLNDIGYVRPDYADVPVQTSFSDQIGFDNIQYEKIESKVDILKPGPCTLDTLFDGHIISSTAKQVTVSLGTEEESTVFYCRDFGLGGDLTVNKELQIKNNGGQATVLLDGDLIIADDIYYTNDNLDDINKIAAIGWIVKGNITFKAYEVSEPAEDPDNPVGEVPNCYPYNFNYPTGKWCQDYSLVADGDSDGDVDLLYYRKEDGKLILGPVHVVGSFFSPGQFKTGKIHLPLTIKGSLIVRDIELERLTFPN